MNMILVNVTILEIILALSLYYHFLLNMYHTGLN